MAAQLVAFSSLLLGSAFLVLASGLNGILLSLRGAIEGFSTTELGLLGTGWAVGFVTATLLIPHVVRRVGHVRGYGAAASLAAIAILMCALSITPVSWIAFRALTGFCFASAAMIVESWLNERTARENRGTVFSVYQMVNFAASTAGQFVIALRPPTDFFFFAVAAILYCLAILPTALSTAESPRALRTTQLNLARVFRTSPVSAVGCVLAGLANSAFGALGPVYGQQIGLQVRDIASLMAFALLGGSLIQFPLGWLSDRMDRRRILLAIAVGAGVLGLAFALARPRDATLIVAMATVYGMLLYPMYAVIVAHANDFAEPDEFVSIAGTLLLLYGTGTMFGPLGAAYLMDRISPDGLFAFTALVHLTLAGYVAFRITRRGPPERNRFRGMPAPKTVTPESAVLDPRAEDDDRRPAP